MRVNVKRCALLLMTAMLASCGKPQSGTTGSAPEPSATRTETNVTSSRPDTNSHESSDSSEALRPIADEGPIIAAIDHFRQLPGMGRRNSSAAEGVLLLDGSYETSKGFISIDQLRGDLSREGWSVPEEARLDMERRLAAHDPFPVSVLPAYIRVLDFSTNPPGHFEFSERHPDAKCFISLWPPGYTADRSQAVVRFMWGPTAHGASAVYLLEFRDGAWIVIHSKVGLYG